MRAQTASYLDVRRWLDLAAEVEGLFGDMLGGPGFYQALLRNIARGTALCVREGDGDTPAPFIGGLLFASAAWPYRMSDRLAVRGRKVAAPRRRPCARRARPSSRGGSRCGHCRHIWRGCRDA